MNRFMGEEVEILRSSRKSIRIEISPEGKLRVRAPLRASEQRILQCLQNNTCWIEKNLTRVRQKIASFPAVQPLTQEELKSLVKQAAEDIPPRVARYAALLGVTYGRITIRAQHTRWGSCSSKGNLNFNCLLMLAPPQVRDSVVVHELCHRKQMNHSEAFYRLVYGVMPNYAEHNTWLKKNGGQLLRRLPR